jgi:Ser/Thr protein kinase RdoA (MazF antagonist)
MLLKPDDAKPSPTIVRRWFPTARCRISPIPSAGLSGSPVWLVEPEEPLEAPPRRFVLKGFAESWPRQRAEAIHRWMAAARRAGVGAVPANLEVTAADGAETTTIATDGDGRCFEMTPWHPGQPVAAPLPRQAAAALETLARIHVALRQASSNEETPTASPPAWVRRADALRAVIARGWDEPTRGSLSPLQAAVAERRRAAAVLLRDQGGLSYLSRLAAVVPPAVPLQPVLRDVWQAHVLFVGDEVSAVIDWHAAGIDTPATDLARLLGSWEVPRSATVGADSLSADSLSVAWGEALEAYRAIRPLSREELALIDLLHLAGVVGGLHHWFRWVLDENRHFPDPSSVLERVDALLKNLAFSGEKTDGGSGGLH